MKFAWERESDEGFCTLAATPDDYDAFPPVQVLSMDYIPRLVSNDRLAVSCALAFGYYAGGAVHFMTPVSAELADAAVAVMKPAAVAVPTVDYVPKAMTYGSNLFKLSMTDYPSSAPQWQGFGTPREFELRMPSMSDTYASSFSQEVLQVPTNADLLTPHQASTDDKLLPYLAQAILLAEDLDIGVVKLPPGISRSAKLSIVAELMQTCGIALQFSE